MRFCCFRSTYSAEGVQDAVPAKFSERQGKAAVENGVKATNNITQPSQTAVIDVSEKRRPAASGSSPNTAKSQQDAVMRVVALLQELLGLTSERMQVSRIMALLCQRLSVSWACLTALSADGNVFQHIGSAYLVEPKIGTCSSCGRTNSGLPQAQAGGGGGPGMGPGACRSPPSRTSSTSSIAGTSIVEVAMSDPHPLRGSETSVEAATLANQPLMLSDPGPAPPPPPGAAVSGPTSIGQLHPQPPSAWPSTGAGPDPSQPPGHPPQQHQHPPSPTTLHQQPQQRSSLQHQPHPPQPHPQQHQHPQLLTSQGSQESQGGGGGGGPPQQQRALGELPVSAWPIDWQMLYRERGLRAFACLPVPATNGSGTVIGCLSLGSNEPLDWSRQFWSGSAKLITGWAAGAITTTCANARATFFSRLFGATDLGGLARAFAYDMPVFLSDGAAGPGTALPEVRLALVSSRLQHAVVYAAPLLQVSGRLGLRPAYQVGAGGGGCDSSPSFMALGLSGPCGSGVSLAGLVLSSANSLGTERGLLLGGGGGVVPTAHPAAAAAARGATTSGYEAASECMVLGTPLCDAEDLMSGCSSSNSAGGGGASARRVGGGGSGGQVVGADGKPSSSPPEAPPVDCVRISTDSTLLMSVLEAGDIMIIKDALQYFGGGRMVARDLALNNTRPATAGTLVILPLVHRCRSLGCVYVFARNELNLSFSRAAWADLAAMLSRAVFGQLVGKLRHEWYAVLSEDPEQPAMHLARAGGAGGVGDRGRVRRTATGNSLWSNASSLRPSFEMPSRSLEQASGTGGGGGGAAHKDAAAALAAAAAVLEYAGFMLPDGDDAPTAALPTAAALALPPQSSGPAITSSSSPRHLIRPEHAAVGNADGGGSGGSGGDGGSGTGGGGPEWSEATSGGAPPVVEVAAAKPATSDPSSTSPGSLSFRLPPEVKAAAATTAAAAAAPPDPTAAAAPEPHADLALAAVAAGQEASAAQAAAGGCGGMQQGRTVRTLESLAGAEEMAADRPGPPGAECGSAAQPCGGGTAAAGVAAAPGGTAAEPAGCALQGADAGAEEDAEEISGSSRELQGWPELVDILYDMHRTRNVSVYLASYRGQAVVVKMMRSHMSMDGRPGHLESEANTIAAQQLLSTVRHPNVLRVLMVYPLVYEVVAGKPQRMPSGTAAAAVAGGTAASNTAFNMHGHSSHPQLFLPHHPCQQQHQYQQQPYGLGLGLPGPLNMMAHSMNDLMAGAAAADAPSGGVYLTAVLPRREKFKRGLALMLELFPSISLREAMQKRMLIAAAAPDTAANGGGLMLGEQLAAAAAAMPYTYVTSSQTTATLSEAGHPGVPTSGQVCSGGIGFVAAAGHQPPFLPPLPEAASGNELNVDSSPGLALTGASNSGGGNAGTYGNSQGLSAAGAPPMPLLLSILAQVAAGMAALHAAGMAHGELRPENVLLAMPHGGCSHASSGRQDRTGANTEATPRASPTPVAAASGGAGAGVVHSGGNGVGGGSRGRSGGGSGCISGSSGCCGGGTPTEPERSSRPERPALGRPLTADVIAKIKDAGMAVVGYSKGSQTVRKLLQRNRSAILPYLPPEVHRGERFGRSADVYTFGLLMWELYTGSVAFSNLAGTPIKLLQTIIADGVRPPWPEGTPLWYQALAARCWAGNPKQRPSFRRIGEKLAEASSAAALATTAAAAVGGGWSGGWPGGGGGGGGGGGLQGVAEGP